MQVFLSLTSFSPLRKTKKEFFSKNNKTRTQVLSSCEKSSRAFDFHTKFKMALGEGLNEMTVILCFKLYII